MKAYLEKRTSAKTKKDYTTLVIEKGTGNTVLLFPDFVTQLKLTNMTPDELSELKVGEKIYIE